MRTLHKFGINYSLPEVNLIHKTPLFVGEYAARTCYSSFDKSEHECIKRINIEGFSDENINECERVLNDNGSSLLHNLSHVYFHESTLEHIVLNFSIKNISRAVLQELARHRIASYSVQSTRYTINDIINWFNSCVHLNNKIKFIDEIRKLNIYILDDSELEILEISAMWEKLILQRNRLGEEEFNKLSISKSLLTDFMQSKMSDPDIIFNILNSKNKKNVGDFIKGSIISDNISVDLSFTINLRSLKNFLDLRMSGAAWFQIQWLSKEIYETLPPAYLSLVVNDNKIKQYNTIIENNFI